MTATTAGVAAMRQYPRLMLTLGAALTAASMTTFVFGFHLGIPGRGSWLMIPGMAMWCAALAVIFDAIGNVGEANRDEDGLVIDLREHSQA